MINTYKRICIAYGEPDNDGYCGYGVQTRHNTKESCELAGYIWSEGGEPCEEPNLTIDDCKQLSELISESDSGDIDGGV